MTEEHDNYIFGSLENAYGEARVAFEAERSSQRTGQLVDDIASIIDRSRGDTSDNVRAERGIYEEENSITLTVAGIQFGDLIEVGETAVTKSSDWIPAGQREIKGSKVNFQIRFQKVEFVRLEGNEPKSRLGPVFIDGQLVDDDGVKADFPLARFYPDKKTGAFKLYYNFGNEIPFRSEDYREVERIVQVAKNPQVESQP